MKVAGKYSCMCSAELVTFESELLSSIFFFSKDGRKQKLQVMGTKRQVTLTNPEILWRIAEDLL